MKTLTAFTLTLFGFVALSLMRSAKESEDPHVSRAGLWVVVALFAQVSIGIGVVWFGLPLLLATAHNGVAALLLLSTINLNHAASLSRQAPQPAIPIIPDSVRAKTSPRPSDRAAIA